MRVARQDGWATVFAKGSAPVTILKPFLAKWFAVRHDDGRVERFTNRQMQYLLERLMGRPCPMEKPK